MIYRAISIVLLAFAVLLGGCQSATHRNSSKPTVAATTAPASAPEPGYALLYSTIKDESQLDRVLIIKRPNPQVAELIKAIAQFSRDTLDKLKAMAKEDPTINFENDGLPEVETKARKAINGDTTKLIISNGGREFEFRILLTQHEALNYITYLAATLSKQEIPEARKVYLTKLAEESNVLHDRVILQLEAPYVGQPK